MRSLPVRHLDYPGELLIQRYVQHSLNFMEGKREFCA